MSNVGWSSSLLDTCQRST